MSRLPRRRRSVLYVPASNARAMAKIPDLVCDAVIIDLEDAVAPGAKDEARTAARAALESGLLAGKEVIVRVNGFPDRGDAPDHLADDLAAIIPAGPDAVLFPKIRSLTDAERASRALDHHFAPLSLRLWLMIETPQSIVDIASITRLGQVDDSRLDCLVMGTNDLAKEMRIRITPSRLALLHALCATIVAARANGLDILDGVFGALNDGSGFETECLQARGLGFDGKTLIHPAQIDIANRIFRPTEGEIREAQSIIAAFGAPENGELGVITVDGKMVERLHLDIARRIIAMEEAPLR